MRRRFRIVLIICLVAAAGELIWFAINSGSVDDPVYHGRRLTSWLNNAYGSSARDPAAGFAASEALFALGTNAFPCLLKLAAASDSSAKQKFLDWLNQHHVSFIHITSAGDRHFEAIEGFRFLHAVAQPALPALSKLLNDPGSTGTAARILSGLGPDAIGTLTNALTNTNPEIRACALYGLGLLPRQLLQNNPPATLAEADAKVIVSIFTGSLSDTNTSVRRWAASSLGWVARKPDIAVPALIQALSDTDTDVRDRAIYSLGKFGSNAVPAIPALVQLLTNNDAELRRSANNALKAIDPAAAQAGVK